MILCDTNIFVYAIGGEHPLREPCGRFLQSVGTGALGARTIEAVYFELLHVLARRQPRHVAAQMTRDAVQLLGPPVDLTPGDLATAIDLYVRHGRLEAVDALLAAAGLRADVQAVVTADRAFSEVPGVRALDPRSPEVARMLA